MTTIIDVTVKCPYCGHEFKTYAYGSYHNFGFDDLDGKVGDDSAPQYNIASFAHFCPECGLCFFVDGEVITSEIKEYMQTEGYVKCKGLNLVGRTAEVFRYGLRRLKEMHDIEAMEEAETEESKRLKYKKRGEAISAFQDVAWMMRNIEKAKLIRKEIVQLMSDDYIESIPDSERASANRIRADIMRQAGMFEEVIKSYDNVHFNEEYEEKCLRFIVEKAKKEDDSPYSTEVVFWKQDPVDYYGTYWASYHEDDDTHSSLMKIDDNGIRFSYSHLEDKWVYPDDDIDETIRYLKVSGKQEVKEGDVEQVKKSVYKYWFNWFHRIGHYWEHWGEEPIIVKDMPNTYWAAHEEGDEEGEYDSLIRFDEDCSAEYYDAVNEKWCDLTTINNAEELEKVIMGGDDGITGRDFYYYHRIEEKEIKRVMSNMKKEEE